MAVSLTKKSLVREYTPEHIRSEEETLPPKQPNGYAPEHIVVEPAPQPLTKPESIQVEVVNSDLTVVDRGELCQMMQRTTDEILILYSKVEKITTEAERRAKIDKYYNENRFGNVGYFHAKVGKIISKAHRRYKRRHIMDWLTIETFNKISWVLLVLFAIAFIVFFTKGVVDGTIDTQVFFNN